MLLTRISARALVFKVMSFQIMIIRQLLPILVSLHLFADWLFEHHNSRRRVNLLQTRRKSKEGIPKQRNFPRSESATYPMAVPKVPGCTPDPVYQLRVGTLASQREDRWNPSAREEGRYTSILNLQRPFIQDILKYTGTWELGTPKGL